MEFQQRKKIVFIRSKCIQVSIFKNEKKTEIEREKMFQCSTESTENEECENKNKEIERRLWKFKLIVVNWGNVY